jgi:plasmid maintenance system antidote protein VapI
MTVTVTSPKRKAKTLIRSRSIGPKRLTVIAAAQILGVHRVHLSYVIHGHRTSRELLRRYRDLVKEARA